MNPISVTVRLFSRLREVAGTDAIPMRVPPGSTIRDVLTLLYRERPSLAALDGSVLVALNEEWSDRDSPLADHDELALMPPVSGG